MPLFKPQHSIQAKFPLPAAYEEVVHIQHEEKREYAENHHAEGEHGLRGFPAGQIGKAVGKHKPRYQKIHAAYHRRGDYVRHICALIPADICKGKLCIKGIKQGRCPLPKARSGLILCGRKTRCCSPPRGISG